MKKIFMLFFVIATVGCLSKKTAPPAKAVADTALTATLSPEMVKYNEGKLLYEKNCNTCHKLIAPKEVTENIWRTEVPIMVRKANNNKGATIDALQQELILNYVLTANRN